MPSQEFNWFQEMAAQLSQRYAFQWIAVDGKRISGNSTAFDSIVVGVGDSLGEALEVARQKDFEPLSLFYVFIRPTLDFHTRQSSE